MTHATRHAAKPQGSVVSWSLLVQRHKNTRNTHALSTIVIELTPETYKRLEEQARRLGQAPEVLSRTLLEAALQASEAAPPTTARAVLEAAGRIRPLSAPLRRKILPGVTLEEVRATLSQAAGPALSDIIQAQRGEKP
jgi:hypothetical protein